MLPARLRTALLTAVVALSSAATPLLAESRGRSATLPERIQGSARVVVARAASRSASWRVNQFGDRLIVSRITLDVEETIKGAAGRRVYLDVEGGTLDGYTLRVSSQAVIEVGERAVFFLDETAPNVFAPHLRAQGVLRLGADDVVEGSSVHLNDIRGLARQPGR